MMSTDEEAVQSSSIPGTINSLSTTESERGPLQTQQHHTDSRQAASNTINNEKETSEPLEKSETIARDSVLDDTPLQVIAVGAAKGPAAYFNLARKFLVSDEMCELSALEGAIVSAVDAAHLLERSQLATIVRVHTSYVRVEPKRRRQPSSPQTVSTSDGSSATMPLPETDRQESSTQAQIGRDQDHVSLPQGAQQARSRNTTGARELRRARIVITVKRTKGYETWLEENPLLSGSTTAREDAEA